MTKGILGRVGIAFMVTAVLQVTIPEVDTLSGILYAVGVALFTAFGITDE